MGLQPCNLGLFLQWDPAAFPAAGRGVYHVYRSTLGFADALSSRAITPMSGLSTTSFADRTAPAGVPCWYVVLAESTDLPGCGSGPLVQGSTAELDLGPVVDEHGSAGPVGIVGPTLRVTSTDPAVAHLSWLGASALDSGETYVVRRSDGDPRSVVDRVGRVTSQAWTDTNAPPRFVPVHVWFYDVRMADACLNLSRD